jgi:adenine-specific DNA-methyltransferase
MAGWNPFDPMHSAKFFDPETMFGFKLGFDLIIGNPPWGAKLSAEDKELFKIAYPEIDSSTPNSFAYFLGWAMKNYRCVISYVLPDSILIKDYAKTRRLIKDFIHEIHWYENTGLPEEHRPFVYVEHDVCVMNILKSKVPKLNYSLFRFDRTSNFVKETKLIQTKSKIILEEFDFAINLIAQEKDFIILKKIQQFEQLDNFVQCHEGIHTGNSRDLLFIQMPKNKSCHPLFYGGSAGDIIENYASQTSGWFVDYRTDIIDKSKGFYASLRDERIFKFPKIYITRTGNPFKAFYDDVTYASNNFFSLQHIDYSKNDEQFLIFILPFIISKIAQYFIRTFAAPRLGSTFIETKIFHLLKFRVPTETMQKQTINRYVGYALLLKKQKKDASFFERLIDAMVYELYLEESIKTAGCEVLKYLNNLPDLEDGEDEKNLKTIEQVYKELSNPSHPVSKAIDRMDAIEEIRIIEGKI